MQDPVGPKKYGDTIWVPGPGTQAPVAEFGTRDLRYSVPNHNYAFRDQTIWDPGPGTWDPLGPEKNGHTIWDPGPETQGPGMLGCTKIGLGNDEASFFPTRPYRELGKS